MHTRHRNRIIIGVAAWFVVLAAIILLMFLGREREGRTPAVSGSTFGWLLLTAVVFQTVCFFWAGDCLARAKGLPEIVLYLGLLGPCLQLLLLTVLLAMEDRTPQTRPREAAEGRHRTRESGIARVVRYRRNALLGNVLGVVGIFLGLSVVLLPPGLLADLDNEVVVGIFIFMAGYMGVITGCWWWVRAKDWVDAVVFIGLLPLAMFFVPFVRLIFVANPDLLAVPMIMMPLILLVVVWALPDKSGFARRRASRRR